MIASKIRPLREYVAPTQCECTSMEWKGYNEWYVKKRRQDIQRKGWNENQCNRAAAYEIGGKKFCSQHAGGAALKLLLESKYDDHELWDAVRENCWDVRCISVPIPLSEDADINWIVVEHHMAEPHERIVGAAYHEEPRDAVRAAMKGANRGRSKKNDSEGGKSGVDGRDSREQDPDVYPEIVAGGA